MAPRNAGIKGTPARKPFDPVRLRRTVLDMAYAGSSVHIACAFSIIELVAVLYRRFLRYPGNDPGSEGRDYFVLSKGHGVMAQYACMFEKGWIERKEIDGYFADGSRLTGLSDSRVRGLEVTSGSLGHGLSVGVGLALSARLRSTDQRVYALVGDGELNEGAIWEAVLFAAHWRLGNLLIIVDANGFQAMGSTREVMDLGTLTQKFIAFGLQVEEVDGHDEAAIESAIAHLSSAANQMPSALIARTTKGKGVSFMENDNSWHYQRLDAEAYKRAIEALRSPFQ